MPKPFGIRLFLLLLLGVAACAPSRQFVPLASANTTANGANIYVIRTSAVGSAIPFAIYCDSLKVGTVGPKGYLFWPVEAGLHQLSIGGETQKDYALRAEAGKVYHFKAVPQLGMFIARAKLVLLTPEEALLALKKANEPILELGIPIGNP